jgi:hypothetical protein
MHPMAHVFSAESPEEAYPSELLGTLTDDGVAVAEIAGRDSVAAAAAAVRERGFETILPTAVHTSTEYGDPGSPALARDTLARLVGDAAHVHELVHLGSPRLWAALNGRFARVVEERFGIHSPCLACHLYMHLCRVPLCRTLGGVPLISGERDTHDGRIKLSQTTRGIDASIAVLSYGGIELLEPIRHASGEDVERLIGDGWQQEARQLDCVLSGNYLDADGEATYDEEAFDAYASGFLEPAGRAIVDAWTREPHPDYIAVVRGVLS